MEVERRTFGELLRHYRKRKYSNLRKLADELLTSKDVLSNYENDKIRPDHEMLVKLIKKLEMPTLPLLRALSYPLDKPSGTFEDFLAEDDLLDDAGKDFVRRALLHEYKEAERRDAVKKQGETTSQAERIKNASRKSKLAV